jgi:tRNA G26 N,N-dimethylase Trm1|tara:strand:+ start:999 stop:1211 length:213 start_codon:yes stop_codon:yes gene_type:complete
MSIGLVLRHTYQETCEICEKVAHLVSKVWDGIVAHAEIVGTARAAAQLSQQGYHKEAKALMLELDRMKKQ